MNKYPNRRFGLSKSKITAFEQCPRKLWLAVHSPEQAQPDEGAQARFAAGHQVGELACTLYPSGVMVEAEPDLSAALAATATLIKEGHSGPIFEATFEHEGVLVRVDVMERTATGSWHMAEVKSSTAPKDYHTGDLATQLWVVRANGLLIESAAIRHIDTSFVLKEEGDYSGLLTDADLLAEAEALAMTRPALVEEVRRILAGEYPVCDIGPHCEKPFACEFSAYCSRDLPPGPEWPVTLLPHGAGKKWAAKGIDNLLDLNDRELSDRNARILEATRSGLPSHDVEAAREVLDAWAYPRAFLDFETINPAVPRWIGTRPYQRVPFQFSLHLQQADGSMTHHEFLCADGGDPRRACAEALIAMIPSEATVIAYNASFEKRVLRELARDCPAFSDDLLAMEERTVDLLPVARGCWYHRDQRGSWSIKAVLPTLADLDYGALEVKDGGDAQAAYLEAAATDCSDDRRWALEEAMRAYCARDTWAMVLVADRLVGRTDQA